MSMKAGGSDWCVFLRYWGMKNILLDSINLTSNWKENVDIWRVWFLNSFDETILLEKLMKTLDDQLPQPVTRFARFNWDPPASWSMVFRVPAAFENPRVFCGVHWLFGNSLWLGKRLIIIKYICPVWFVSCYYGCCPSSSTLLNRPREVWSNV